MTVVSISRVQMATRNYLPAAFLFVAGLTVWEAAVVAFDIKGFLLPRPSVIWTTFVREFEVVSSAGLFTLKEAVGGFALGSVLGIISALATARWSMIREGILPFAIAANSTPIIALAPITNQWFGITNPLAKMTVVAVMVFFPVMINMVRGLTEVGDSDIELLHSYAARPSQILFKVRIPNSLPYLFSAFKVAAALAVIGAIVAEYFGGSREALGVYISQQAALFHFAEAWAAIIVGSAMGLAFYGIILGAERLFMPWHVSIRGDSR